MFNDITVLAKQSKLVNTTKRLLKKALMFILLQTTGILFAEAWVN